MRICVVEFILKRKEWRRKKNMTNENYIIIRIKY